MIVVDSSVWIDFFNGVSTPEVERLDGLLGVTPRATGDRMLLEVMQGGSKAWKAAEKSRQLRSRGITLPKTIEGIIATVCHCFAEA